MVRFRPVITKSLGDKVTYLTWIQRRKSHYIIKDANCNNSKFTRSPPKQTAGNKNWINLESSKKDYFWQNIAKLWIDNGWIDWCRWKSYRTKRYGFDYPVFKYNLIDVLSKTSYIIIY